MGEPRVTQHGHGDGTVCSMVAGPGSRAAIPLPANPSTPLQCRGAVVEIGAEGVSSSRTGPPAALGQGGMLASVTASLYSPQTRGRVADATTLHRYQTYTRLCVDLSRRGVRRWTLHRRAEQDPGGAAHVGSRRTVVAAEPRRSTPHPRHVSYSGTRRKAPQCRSQRLPARTPAVVRSNHDPRLQTQREDSAVSGKLNIYHT
jgi:hypothetical protein